MRPFVKFNYLNHHGKLAERRVVVESLEWLPNPGFGYSPGWFLSGFDLDKRGKRSFALARVEPQAGALFRLPASAKLDFEITAAGGGKGEEGNE